MSTPRFKTDPDNHPRPMPGAYLVRNLINGKCYVGISQNVSRRRAEHTRGDGTAPLLTKAIRKYGVENFEFVPLFYSMTGTLFLPELEATLIAAYDALVPNGYNVQASSGAVGPYGPAFGEILRLAFAKPETKARKSAAAKSRDPILMKKFWEAAQAPEVKARAIATMTATRRRPEVRLAQSIRVKAMNADPEFVANRTQKAVLTKSDPAWKARVAPSYSEAQNRPDVKAKKSVAIQAALATPEAKANRLGRFWITDGTVELKVA